MKNSKTRQHLGAVAVALLVAAAIFAFTQLRSQSGSQLRAGKIETVDHGITIYHLQDGWLIKGLDAEIGKPGVRNWLILVANREKGTRFNVVPGGVEWNSDHTEWALSTKGEIRDATAEKARWVTGVNITEPRTTTGMLVDDDVLASVEREPSKYSAYELYELQGPKVERPTP